MLCFGALMDVWRIFSIQYLTRIVHCFNGTVNDAGRGTMSTAWCDSNACKLYPSELAQPAEIGLIGFMGKVIIKIKLTNLSDLFVKQRKLSTAKPREVEVEALVDAGAAGLCLKRSVIRALGLEKLETIVTQTSTRPAEGAVYEPVQLAIQGRQGTFDVLDVGENAPNSVGQIPLFFLDFVVDSKNRKLIGTPEHGGQWMTEQYLLNQ